MRIITQREAAMLGFDDGVKFTIWRMGKLAQQIKEAGERMQELGRAMADLEGVNHRPSPFR